MKKSVHDQIAEYETEIQKSIERWNHIKKHGATDPFWPDGCNMNLVRNHIIYYLMKIRELTSCTIQLSMFDSHIGSASESVLRDKRVPPKVEENYMATDRKLLFQIK